MATVIAAGGVSFTILGWKLPEIGREHQMLSLSILMMDSLDVSATGLIPPCPSPAHE